MDPFAAPSIHALATDAVAFTFRDSLLLWYRIPAAVASLLLLLATFLGKGRNNSGAAAPLSRGDSLYLLAIAVFLFAQRWPALAIGDLEGDESLTVSAALSRYLDPAYGVTLFTGSAGPLLSYPVAVLGLLGLRIDYGASKLVSMLVMIATSGLLYLALRTFSETRTARVALLPLLAFFGLSNRHWTISYCSEQWINLLVISMIYCLLRLDRRIGREPVNLAGMGLALGLMPLVKWQGMPMAALVAACGVGVVASRACASEPALAGSPSGCWPLALPGLAPLLIWCAIVWSQGSLGFFFDTYFAALLHQATSRYPTTFAWRLQAMPSWGFPAYSLERWFLILTALFWVPGAILLWLSRRRGRARLELALAFLYLAVSLYAVLQPGGSFPHYLNLLLLPWALLFSLVFCRLCQAVARPDPGRGAISRARGRRPGPDLASGRSASGALPAHRISREIRGSPARASGCRPPDDPVGMGLRVLCTLRNVMGEPDRREQRDPGAFLPRTSSSTSRITWRASRADARPSSSIRRWKASMVYADRERWGHEQIPEVAEAVRRNYFPCAEFPGARLFLLRTRYEGRTEIRGLVRAVCRSCTPPKRP